MSNYILGIWDGHDAGCALIKDQQLIFAANEERFTRRKLEIGFPQKSILAALEFAGINASDIQNVAFSTGDFAKTLSRYMPSAQEDYYQLRRRKKYPTFFNRFKKKLKYKLTEIGPCFVTNFLSRQYIKKQLATIGIHTENLELVGHHDAHAACAALPSGFSDCLIVTLDGIGDGLSGSFFKYSDNGFNRISCIRGSTSLGIFYEHVTNLLHLRELEDEGKVMAMAASTFPIPDDKNRLLDFFIIDGLNIKCRYSSLELYSELEKELYLWSPEQFSYLAQRTLEKFALELIRNAISKTGMRKIAFAGGVAANVKLNRLIRELPEVDDLYIFPHMGDGGLAIGAALWLANKKYQLKNLTLNDLYLGPEISKEQIEQAKQKNTDLQWQKQTNIAQKAAELIASKEIIMWFQGRMELGPRALGARSILALPNSQDMRDELNLRLKKRSWYQPYCPVMLTKEASQNLINYKSPNKFMTEAYQIHPSKKSVLDGVISPDLSCRPQILDETQDHSPYVDLLLEIRKKTGQGILLNTSYNLHGEPIVCTPTDAIKTFKNCDLKYLVMGDYLIEKIKF